MESEELAAPGRDLANFLLDLSDDSCPLARRLHLPAYNGDARALRQALQDGDPAVREQLDSKVRPFSATPLRLAATGVAVTPPANECRVCQKNCWERYPRVPFMH